MTEMTAIKLNQLKKASEAYKELRGLHTDPVTEEVDGEFPAWSVFRDGFIADWTANRIIVDEKEADAMFEKTAEEALAEIEAAEAGIVEEVSTETTTAVAAPVAEEAPVVAKRRGRPPGSGNKAKATKAAAVVKAKATKKAGKKKVAAKKKSAGTSKMDAARVTVEKFAAKGWSRKDIIQRLIDVNGLTPAYAATAYQKIA